MQTRYSLLALTFALGLMFFMPDDQALAAKKVHGLSPFGELKYGPDFKHFDYVNPSAPKGGSLSMIGPSRLKSFNSFNDFILKGDAAQGLSSLFDTLMEGAGDEPGSIYGLVAQSAEVADDKKSVTFFMRPEAKFSDGSQVTAKDAVFSFDILKSKGHPAYALQLRDVVKAEAIDDLTVRYYFKGEQVRDLPRLVASLPLLSATYYKTHDFSKTSLDAPLGSGAYKIKKYDQGRFITYERRNDYWAKDLPINIGRYNFDELRYEYYRDDTSEFEGLTSHTYDLREEFTSKNWATGYNIPQIKSGKLKRDTLPDKSPSGAQGFFMNMRRDKFKDPRVREALDLAFDFEWTNKNLFFDSYIRTQSFFENSDMKAHGKPSEEELVLLEPYRDKLPKEVFGTPYTPPKTSGAGKDRGNLRRAQKLLAEAGWKVGNEVIAEKDCGFFCRLMTSIGLRSQKKNAVLRNKSGKEFTIEFLSVSPAFERIISPYIQNLRTLGIKAKIRMVDSSQYERRLKDFDFDVTTSRFVLGLTPGISMRNYWSTTSANTKGSRNLSGIKSPVIDALIEKMIGAKSRKELIIAAKALDRVLRAGHYWVPQWYYPFHRMAYWDKFGKPANKPPYARAIIDTWWVDKVKEAKLKKK